MVYSTYPCYQAFIYVPEIKEYSIGFHLAIHMYKKSWYMLFCVTSRVNTVEITHRHMQKSPTYSDLVIGSSAMPLKQIATKDLSSIATGIQILSYMSNFS